MNENDVIEKMTSQMRAKLYSLRWKSWFWCTSWTLHVILNTFTHDKQFNILHIQWSFIIWSLRQISCCLSLAISVNINENQVPYLEYPFPFYVYQNGKVSIESHGGGSVSGFGHGRAATVPGTLPIHWMTKVKKHNDLYVYIDRLWP